MKEKMIGVLLVCSIGVALAGCGNAQNVSTLSAYVETIGQATLENQTVDNKESSLSVEAIEESTEKEMAVGQETEMTEEKTASEPVVSSEEVMTDEADPQLIPEEELVHVVIPEMNIGSMQMLYDKADYKVEGDITIDDSIDFGIRVDSDDIRKLITLIYQGTGCTSHTISDEFIALFDYDPFDYSAVMTLSDGNVYCLYLVEGRCFALSEI